MGSDVAGSSSVTRCSVLHGPQQTQKKPRSHNLLCRVRRVSDSTEANDGHRGTESNMQLDYVPYGSVLWPRRKQPEGELVEKESMILERKSEEWAESPVDVTLIPL